MAMRWSSSRLGALALVMACVSTTTRFFLPSPQNPVYTPPQAEQVLATYVRLQCEPLRKAQKPDSGSVRFVIDFDTLGLATKAELQRSTGDDMVDGIFGTVAAQLSVVGSMSGAQAARRERVAMRFRCAGDSVTVGVVAPER